MPLALGSVLIAGCYGEVPTPQPADASSAAGSDAAAEPAGIADGGPADSLPGTGADAATPESPGGPAPSGASETDELADYFTDGGYMLQGAHANVVRAFAFPLATDDGVAYGFDLDGKVSEDGDPAGCGHGDLVGLDGSPGIDNQLARVWVAVAPIVGVQVDNLLQGAINEGKVLLMIELEGVDDLTNDDDVTLHVFRGTLDPIIGTQGLIAPGQTFYMDPGLGVSTVEGVQIVDGEVDAGPVEFQLPIDILDADFTLRVRDGRMRFRIGDDGSFEGIAGGAISVSELRADLENTGGNADVQLVAPFFETNADLAPDADGECDLFSVAIGVSGAQAFVVRYPNE